MIGLGRNKRQVRIWFLGRRRRRVRTEAQSTEQKEGQEPEK